MVKQWAVLGNTWWLGDITNAQKKLRNIVYKVELCKKTGELYLAESQDKFVFPYKVYGKDSKFIKRVLTTYANTKGNLGVLLNGIKGTGKTVTAELICNALEMPVIIVTGQYDDLPLFLNSIQEDVVVFFDEYEKIYVDRDRGDVLSVMDGVLNTEFRKVFLLTTNNTYINENLLQRPGRIRYLREFKDLDKEVILEIIDDKLEKKEFREDIIKFISELQIITVDIVKAIVDEVNIHGEAPEDFKDVFNVKRIDSKKDIKEVIKKSDTETEYLTIKKNSKINPVRITEDQIGGYVYAGSLNLGILTEIIDEETFVFERREFVPNDSSTKVELDEDGELVDYSVEDKGKYTQVRRVYKIEDHIGMHSSFSRAF